MNIGTKKKKSPYRPDGSFRPQKWNRPTYPAYDREKHRVLNMIRRLELTDDEVLSRLAAHGVSMTKTTLYNWRLGYQFGGTRYPAGWRLHALAEALGFPYVPVAVDDAALKKADVFEDLEVHEHRPKKRRQKAVEPVAVPQVVFTLHPKKGRLGRPKGSKNKKIPAIVAKRRRVGRPARQAA